MTELKGISHSYGKTKALNGVSYTFTNGVYGLLGPNGSGKTTLLNILSGNLRASGGSVLWDGETADKSFFASVGYVPQDCELYPSMSAYDFLRYMAVIKSCGREDSTQQIDGMLRYFELHEVRHQKLCTFSGGMKQRVLLMQAFLGKPALVLLDEPTAGLDPMQRMLVHRFVAEQARDKTVLYATHILPDLKDLCKEVLFLKRGELIRVSHAGDDLEDSYRTLFDNDDACLV